MRISEFIEGPFAVNANEADEAKWCLCGGELELRPAPERYLCLLSHRNPKAQDSRAQRVAFFAKTPSNAAEFYLISSNFSPSSQIVRYCSAKLG